MFDILITIAKKDFNKLWFVVESIRKNIVGYRKIFVISDVEINNKVEGIEYFTDDEVLDFNWSAIDMVNRRGWYKQQFIKLLQEETLSNYLVVDADVYINKPLQIDIAHPFFLFGKDQYHLPYFIFLKDIFRIEKCYPRSFICETMFFKKSIINYMLSELGVNKYQFFDICAKEINKINNGSGFSEYETYGNYVTKYFPDMYQYKNINVLHKWKRRLWTDDEIKNHINNNNNYDILTMHTWI